MNEQAVTIGRLAIWIAMSSENEEMEIYEKAKNNQYRVCKGRVGSMDGEKIFAAVETAAKRNGIINEQQYHEEHALYHATLEAFQGACRGQPLLKGILRSGGFTFGVVRGPRRSGDLSDGEWVAVALFGTMGAPIKGFEHEVIGLGINNLSG